MEDLTGLVFNDLTAVRPAEHVKGRGQVWVWRCVCGNADPDWSEFKKHLWCPTCQKDFIPDHYGVLDGPVPVNISELIGIYFDTLDLETGEIKPGPSGVLHFSKKETA